MQNGVDCITLYSIIHQEALCGMVLQWVMVTADKHCNNEVYIVQHFA